MYNVVEMELHEFLRNTKVYDISHSFQQDLNMDPIFCWPGHTI